MFITITKVEKTQTQKGADCLKVTGIVDGKEVTKTIYGRVGGKWDLLQEGAYLEFIFSDDAKWVNDILLAEKPPTLPSPITAKPISAEAPKKSENPQELGMWYKELGNRIGDGSLEKDFPKSYTEIKTQYYRKMAEVTGVIFHKKE